MKALKSILLLVIYSCSIHALIAQVGIQFEEASWSEVLTKAKEEDKIIFVDAYTTWCGPCKWMSKNVFADTIVGEFYNEKFINVKLDMEKGEGLAFSKKYQVRAYPTLLFINGDGEMVHIGLGSRSVNDFIQLGVFASSEDTQWINLDSRYKSGDREVPFLLDYVAVLDGAGMEKYEAINAYLKTQTDWKTLENVNFIFKHMGYDVSNYLFQYVMEQRDAFQAVLGKEKLEKKLDQAVSMSLPPDANAAQLREAYQKFFPEEWEEKYTIALINNITAGSILASNEETVRITDKYIKEYTDHNWNLLNGVAWHMFESTDDPSLLQSAVTWTLKSIETESNVYNNDTAAWIYYKLGDMYKATAFADIAIRLGKMDGVDVSSTEELVAKIKSNE